MKLSMWILADWLWKYNPIIYIKDGAQTLRGVRLFTADTKMERQNVYLGRAQDFIGSGGDGVICVHEHDMMLLDTNDIEHVLNEIFCAFDFYNKWADDMMDAVNNNCSLQKIIDDSHVVLDEPVIVYDASFKVMGYSSSYKQNFTETEWRKMLSANGNFLNKMVSFKPGLQKENKMQNAHIANFPELTNRSIWVNLSNFKKYLGQVIVIESKHKITEGRLHICETLANIVEYWIRFNEERTEQKLESTIFAGLLEDKHLLKEEVTQQMNQIHWQEHHKKIVIKIFLFENSPEINQKLLYYIEKNLPNCYAILYEFSVAIVCNTSLTDIDVITKELTTLLKQNLCCCGVSFEFTNIMDLRQHYEQADIALKYGSPNAGCINYCSDYIMNYILNQVKTHSKISVIHPIIYILKQFDDENKSELYETLYKYLLHERNLVKTAEALKIHRNSLLYRIKKIKELIDLDLDNPNTRQYLLFSFQLHEYEVNK